MLAIAAAGCGSNHRAVLDEGVTLGAHAKARRISAAEAIADARSTHREWLAMLRTAAIRNPRRHFASPPHRLLLARLAAAAANYRFTIEAVTLHRPLQLAPEIVIESRDYPTLARALPQILDRIDPPPRSNNRAYEGIFIEAVDEQHVPFVIVFDSLRGQVAGGQWARSDPLFPYVHG